MITNESTNQTRHPRGIIQIALAVTLALTPVAIKSHLDENSRAAIAREYQSSRSQVLASINAAVNSRDLTALNRIQSKYAVAVQDPEFKSALGAGMAKLSAREAEIELLISKHLDMARHKEEVSFRVNPQQPQLAHEDHQEKSERLSILP